MGWEPVPGVVGLLKNKDLKRDELRDRKAAIEAAFDSAELPRLGTGLPRRVSLLGTLVFAQSRGWKMPVRFKDLLSRLHHLNESRTGKVAAPPESMVDRRPAEDAELVEISTKAKATPYDTLADRDGNSDEPITRMEKTLLRTLGALAIVLQESAVSGKSSQFLRGTSLNISSVAAHVAATIGEAEGSGGVVPGYTVRTMQLHISRAVDEYYRAKRDLFDTE